MVKKAAAIVNAKNKLSVLVLIPFIFSTKLYELPGPVPIKIKLFILDKNSIKAENKYFADLILDGFPDYYWAETWDTFINSGDDTIVKNKLDILIGAMLNAPENQLMGKEEIL